MPLCPPAPPSLAQLRSFTSSSTLLAKSKNKGVNYAALPPYPYGPSRIYKQANFGLYGTTKIRYGNMVSIKNEIKTRRHWRPNVHYKRLWSDSLGEFIRIKTVAGVLRTIDKCGGLDEYLLGEKAQRIKELGMAGWRLRWRIMQTSTVQERFAKQRQLLGLDPMPGTELSLAEQEDVASSIAEIDAELRKETDIEIGEGEGEMRDENLAEDLEDGFMEEQPGESPAKDKKIVL